MMYQRIMVPLDGSELAESVLPHVKALAEGCQPREIILVRVVETFKPQAGDYVFTEEQTKKMEAERKTAAEEYLKKTAARSDYGAAKVQSQILFGDVAQSLTDFAEKNQVDLIVIATHGRSGVGRWVWGSVADRVLRFSCVPILMVRVPGCLPGF